MHASFLDPATRTVQLRGAARHDAVPDTQYQELAGKLRPIAQGCVSLNAAAKAVRAAADSVGLSEAGKGYELTAVPDKGASCTTIDENVGGTIFLILRGPPAEEGVKTRTDFRAHRRQRHHAGIRVFAGAGAIAARVKEQVTAEEVSAAGRGDRFVVTTKVQAANRPAALAWGRSTLYGVVTDVLDRWSLERIEGSPE